jgi:uncharacterized protein YdaU (DUF1376 family)
MHYYQFNIGDYIKDTAHLELVEDAIYRRLIDHYYMTESPIPNETQTVIKRLRLGSVEVILQAILVEFFHLNPDDNCWHHTRCDKEITAYRKRCEINKKVGKLGGRPKKTESVISGFPEKTLTNNHKPLTINQEPIKDRKRASPFVPPSFIEVQRYIADCNLSINASGFIDYYESNGWMVGKNKMKNWQAACRTWEKRNETNRPNNQADNRSRAKRFSDKLDEIAIRSVAENGFADRVD